MIKDLYIRNPADPNFKYGMLEHTDEIESIITKLKVLLSTRPGEVFGKPGFGLGIDDLIFERRVNKLQLEERIRSQINEYIVESSRYDILPKVSFGREDGHDYAIIDIYINKNKIVGFLVK